MARQPSASGHPGSRTNPHFSYNTIAEPLPSMTRNRMDGQFDPVGNRHPTSHADWVIVDVGDQANTVRGEPLAPIGFGIPDPGPGRDRTRERLRVLVQGAQPQFTPYGPVVGTCLADHAPILTESLCVPVAIATPTHRDPLV